MAQHHKKNRFLSPFFFGWLLYCGFITYGILFPFENWRLPARDPIQIFLYDWIDKIYLFDIIQNLLLFIPFGLIMIIVLAPQSQSNKMLLKLLISVSLICVTAFLFSGSLELLQSYNPVRSPSLLDAILNTFSALAGALLGTCLLPFSEQFARLGKQIFQSPLWLCLGALSLLAWTLWQLYPFVPTLLPEVIRQGIAPLYQNTPLNPELLLEYAISGGLLFIISLMLFKRKFAYLCVIFIAICILMLKIPFREHALTKEAILGLLGTLTLLHCLYFILGKSVTVPSKTSVAKAKVSESVG